MGREWDKLVALIAKLRSPTGCPWDRAQSHESLLPYLREEARETEEALRRGRWEEIEDELGDLLLQVLLHAQIAAERGQFDIEDVARAQRLKLTRRHPHVFGEADYRTPEAVKLNWKDIKGAERRQREADLAERVKKGRRLPKEAASVKRVVSAYRPTGPVRFLQPKDLQKLFALHRLDPKSSDPLIFELESRAHFRQEGVLELFSKMGLGPNSRVLSLGEGNGACSRLLAKTAGCRVTGVDVNPVQVKAARELAAVHGVAGRVEYLLQDVHRLDLGERRFDALYLNETTCHWWSRAQALHRALAYLEPGAVIGFNEWTRGDAGTLEDAARAQKAFGRLYPKGVWFQAPLADYERLLQSLGCEVAELSDVTDAVDARMRRWLEGLRLASQGALRKYPGLARLGVDYLEGMLPTHRKYLRYARIIARKKRPA